MPSYVLPPIQCDVEFDRHCRSGVAWLRMQMTRPRYDCLLRVAEKKRTTVHELTYRAIARELPRAYRPLLFEAPRPGGDVILDLDSDRVQLVLVLPFAVYHWLYAETCRRELNQVPLMFSSRLYANLPRTTRMALLFQRGAVQ